MTPTPPAPAAPPGRALARAVAAVALAALTALLLLAPLALPAHAHGRGSDATNYRSEITERPAVDGLTWRVHGGDELLELRSAHDGEVLVLGYEGEPYLRFTPEGVWENVNSPATYLGEDRYAQVDVPAHASADAEPEWRRVSDTGSYAWHDHRIHWMSPSLPPSVTDPAAETVVSEYTPWRVPIEVDGVAHELAGSLRWIPGPAPWPWLGLGLALCLPALLGVRTRPVGEPPERWPGLARPAAAVLGVVVLLNVTHLVDDLVAVPLPLSTVALAAVQTALFLAIGAFGALRAWQSGPGAFTALGVGSGAILVGQGLLYLPALTASQVASVFPDWLARLTIGASLAQVLTVGAVTVLGTRALMPDLVGGDAPAGSDDGPKADGGGGTDAPAGSGDGPEAHGGRSTDAPADRRP